MVGRKPDPAAGYADVREIELTGCRRPSVGEHGPRNEPEPRHAPLVHDLEAGVDKESAELLW
jgi:hypothetical protein